MTYTHTALLPVSPDEAFALITDPERLRRWQAVSAYVDLRAGGDFRWTVTPGNIAAGTFREIDPGRRLVLGFGWQGRDAVPPDTSMVTVVIEPTPEGSKVTLTHAGLDEEQEKSHAEGWDHYFERLQKFVTTGNAGPDAWAYAPQNLTPVVAAEAVLAVIQPVLRALTDEDKPKPTPCSEFTAHQVAVHLLDTLPRIGAMTGATVQNPEVGSLENKVSVMAGQAIDGWHTVDLTGAISGPGGHEMPATVAASVLPLEMLLHTWDLAQSSGQAIHISDEVVTYLRTLADDVIPGGRAGGNFGPEVEAPADATPLEELAAFAGRTPMHR
jgi:uncharacterized protein (TIGR03086 family)